MEAEKALLGCVLKDNSVLKELTITSEHFSKYENIKLYKVMEDLERDEQPIDAVTIMTKMGAPEFNRVYGFSHISGLMESVPSVHSFKTYETIIINDWKERTVKNTLQEYMHKEGQVEHIQNLISDLNKVDQAGTMETFDKKGLLCKMYDLPITEVPKGLSGVPSGFSDLDDMTDGFQKQDYIVIGARPSMGKTALILNIAVNAGLSGAIPIIFSLEMGEEALVKRMLSSISRVDGIKTRNPYHYFNDNDKERWVDACGVLEKVDFHIFDRPGQKVAEMRSKVRQIQKENEGKNVIVFIDYLTLIKPTKDYNGNAHMMYSEVSADLKGMAKEFNIPVVTLAQLSRGVEQRQSKRPNKSDLRESGSIEQDADIVALLYRDDYYNEESEKQGIIEIIIDKQRNGPVGTVELAYLKEFNSFKNLERRR